MYVSEQLGPTVQREQTFVFESAGADVLFVFQCAVKEQEVEA